MRLIAPRAPDPWGEATSWFFIDDPLRVASGITTRARLVAKFATQMASARNLIALSVLAAFNWFALLSVTESTRAAKERLHELPRSTRASAIA